MDDSGPQRTTMDYNELQRTTTDRNGLRLGLGLGLVVRVEG